MESCEQRDENYTASCVLNFFKAFQLSSTFSYIVRCRNIIIIINLQRVLNAAARVVTSTRKFDRGLGQILHEKLHWLEVPARPGDLQASSVRSPPYLSDYCVPVAGAATRRHLRSANRQLLAVPRDRLNTYGRRVFSVAGPTVWNSLTGGSGTRPSVQSVSDVCRRRIYSLDTSAVSALEVLVDYCAI